jgi:hypothetical protein
MGEFAIAKSYYILSAIAESAVPRAPQSSASTARDVAIKAVKPHNYNDIMEPLTSIGPPCSDASVLDAEKGRLFSAAGPAAAPPGGGCILDDPDLLWAEDAEWTKEQQRESEARLQMQGKGLGDFWRSKYIKETGVYWHEFYKRNADHFYKDRHYLHIVFPELGSDSVDQIRLLEVGCGVGNAIFPLMDLNKRLFVSAIDHAKSAIQILRYLNTYLSISHM